MNGVMVFESNNRKITFEVDKILSEGFIVAKKWLNSIALKTGHFSEYVFNQVDVREPTLDEYNEYIELKDHSLHALKAD